MRRYGGLDIVFGLTERQKLHHGRLTTSARIKIIKKGIELKLTLRLIVITESLLQIGLLPELEIMMISDKDDLSKMEWDIEKKYCFTKNKIDDGDVINQADKQMIDWFWASSSFLNFVIQYNEYKLVKPMESNYL